eukprot:TRINITY_DN1080_c5_g1_i1.p1 TRINITY_DN1080_c5_g1~~TRINITY_DN1080_c5_g1_i1.p1  ORF type:complete len:680 (-),score=269.81 TRINITY_DN1080_c5_g1_i1:114-2153(-)
MDDLPNSNEADEESNPFCVPSDDVFVRREQERKQQERIRRKELPIWERSVQAPSKTQVLLAQTRSKPQSHWAKLNLSNRFQKTLTLSSSSTVAPSSSDATFPSSTSGQTDSLSALLAASSSAAVSADSSSSSSSSSSFLPSSSSLALTSNKKYLDANRSLSTRNEMPSATTTTSLYQGRRREKENMNEFIHKKRTMFLIQTSLETKRQEIKKLEDKAKMKEEALRKSERMLEDDALRFDAFLKMNDERAHEALHKADSEAKEKQDKVNEIKRLTQEIAKVDHEISKLSDALALCKTYKKFLKKLTPEDYKKAQRRKKLEERQKHVAPSSSSSSLISSSSSTLSSAISPSSISSSSSTKASSTSLIVNSGIIGKNAQATAIVSASASALSSSSSSSTTTAPTIASTTITASTFPSSSHLVEEEEGVEERDDDESDDDNDDDDDDEEEEGSEGKDDAGMYFKKPDQLLQIFAQLEEKNLFLIQNKQETEESLEELKQKYSSSQASTKERIDELKSKKADLEAKIEAENEKKIALLKRTRGNTVINNQQALLDKLHRMVGTVHSTCGLDSTSSETADMLKEIESHLEELLSTIASLDPNAVEEAERKQTDIRRSEARQRFQSRNPKLSEEKQQEKAAQRANSQVLRQTGKQLMYRSAPNRKHEEKEVEQKDERLEKIKTIFF